MTMIASEIAEKSTTVRTIPWQLRLVGAVLRRAHAIAPRWVETLALKKFRTPRSHRRPAREAAWLQSAERLRLPYPAPAGAEPDAPRELAAWSWGAGPAVLLVHGWEGRGGQMAAFARPLAARGHRVVTIDAPAHGETGGSQSSLPELAAAVAAAADAVGPLHAVVAHSFGCAGAALAVADGMRSERLVFIAPPEDFGGFLMETVRSLGLPETIYHHVVESIENRFGIRWQHVRRITVDAACETPLLVVHDRGDAETPFTGGQAIARAWPRARLLATDGLGHRRVLRDEAVIAEVARFLTAEPQPLGIAS
jgi:pimeloyl-ACP methyl ester carboxylesterase